MIRRPRLLSSTAAIATVTLAASLTAGCSTFTDNDLAAKAGDTELSNDDLDAINGDLPELSGDASMVPSDLGEFDGDVVRQALTLWANGAGLIAALDERGIDVTDDDRQAAADQLSTQDADTWGTLSGPTQRMLIDLTAARTALETSPEFADPAAARALYEEGVGASGLLCIRIMAFETEEEALEVYEAVQSGEPFATLANDHPVDPAAEPNEGIFADPSTGSECLTATNFGSVAQAVADTPIGEPSLPTTLGSEFFYLILQRPFDEVAETVQPLVAAGAAQAAAQELLHGADVSIASRYGMWDSATATVVPTR